MVSCWLAAKSDRLLNWFLARFLVMTGEDMVAAGYCPCCYCSQPATLARVLAVLGF